MPGRVPSTEAARGEGARRIGLAAAVMITTVLLSRVLGFARDAFIAAAFGATGATDAFYAAFTLPDVLNYLVAGGTLSITFIPIYTRHLTGGDEAEGNRVFSIIATTMGVVLLVAVVLLWLATPALAARYLHRLEPEHLAIAVRLTRILLPAQLFFYLGGLAAATLFARHRFVAAAYAPLVYNLGTIAGGALLGGRLGIDALAWGALAGAVVGPFAIQVIAARRVGLRYRPSLQVGHPEFRAWLWASVPLMVGVSLVTADEWIIRYFAAADLGAISCLSYARKLVMVPIAVAGQAVGQASMPFFARLHAEGKGEELGALVTRSARASGAMAALAGAALVALAQPAVVLLFQRGRFTFAQAGPTTVYTALFALAIPLWGVQGIVARAFYAARDTLTPMLAGSAVTLVSLPLYWGGFRAYGVAGLVMASSAGILLHTAVLLALLPRRVPSVDRRGLVLGIGRALGLGTAAGIAAFAAVRALPSGGLQGGVLALWRLGVGGAVFLAVVMAAARPLGVEDAVVFFDRAGDRIARRLGRRR